MDGACNGGMHRRNVTPCATSSAVNPFLIAGDSYDVVLVLNLINITINNHQQSNNPLSETIMLAAASPFSNSHRPATTAQSSPSSSGNSTNSFPSSQWTTYNPATTHPASLFSSLPNMQRRIHSTSSGNSGMSRASSGITTASSALGCEREGGWVEQWMNVRRDWHPASIWPVGGGVNGLGGEGVTGKEEGSTRAKL